MSRPRIAALTACAAAAALTTAALVPTGASAGSRTAPAPTLPTSGLKILLTNDDGWNAAGITATFDALTAAGHDVTMSAPATNQSGVSAKVSFGGTVDALDRGNNKWSVSDSPVTSLIFGMEHLLKDDRPDLVVSGTNVGSNTGFDTNYSGTIGAATVAAGAYDVPAIAISTDTSGGTGAYARTADLLVDMIAQGIPDLPRGQFINVNYPILTTERPDPVGITYTSNSLATQAAFSFSLQSGDTFKINPGRSSQTSAPGTDAAVLKDGYVAISLLDADRSIAAEDASDVTALVRRLTGEPTPPTPTDDPTSTPSGSPTSQPTPSTKPTGKPTAKPTAPAKVSVQKLPARVLGGTSQWLKGRAADGTRLRITWKPTTLGAKKKSVVRTVTVRGNFVAFKAPRATGTYAVSITHGKAVVCHGKVRVR